MRWKSVSYWLPCAGIAPGKRMGMRGAGVEPGKRLQRMFQKCAGKPVSSWRHAGQYINRHELLCSSPRLMKVTDYFALCALAILWVFALTHPDGCFALIPISPSYGHLSVHAGMPIYMAAVRDFHSKNNCPGPALKQRVPGQLLFRSIILHWLMATQVISQVRFPSGLLLCRA